MKTKEKSTRKRYEGFSAAEKAAMKERVKETRVDVDPEQECLAKIAEMSPSDRHMAERIHALVKKAAPSIQAKTWYGMPAYALDGNTICYFQPAEKFKSRYAMLGFTDKAKLDDGNVWPNSYALLRLTAADETKVAGLIKQAVG